MPKESATRMMKTRKKINSPTDRNFIIYVITKFPMDKQMEEKSKNMKE